MTYLEAVNNVLTRLRESTVTSVQDTAYSRLIGVMVNDAKAQVENAYNWNALNQDILVATSAGVPEYSLVGSGQRFRVIDVLNDTNNQELMVKQWGEISRLSRIGASGDSIPSSYCFHNTDSNGDTKAMLWPTPDGVYSIAFVCTVPQADLSVDAGVISVPSLPVILGAYARACAERGEDQGFVSSEAYGLYKDSLSDAIAIESSRTSEDAGWSA